MKSVAVVFVAVCLVASLAAVEAKTSVLGSQGLFDETCPEIGEKLSDLKSQLIRNYFFSSGQVQHGLHRVQGGSHGSHEVRKLNFVLKAS